MSISATQLAQFDVSKTQCGPRVATGRGQLVAGAVVIPVPGFSGNAVVVGGYESMGVNTGQLGFICAVDAVVVSSSNALDNSFVAFVIFE